MPAWFRSVVKPIVELMAADLKMDSREDSVVCLQ